MKWGAVVDVLYAEDDALVLTDTELFRLSLVGRLIIEACEHGSSRDEIIAFLIAELGPPPGGSVEDAVDEVLGELLRAGVVVDA